MRRCKMSVLQHVPWKVVHPSASCVTCYQFFTSKVFNLNVRLKSTAVEASVSAPSNPSAVDCDKAKPFDDIPGPKGLPLIGSWLDYKRNPWKIHQRHIYIRQLRDRYGEIVKESFAGNTVLHLLGPEYIRKVYENEGKYPYIPPLLPSVGHYRRTQEMSPGLGFSNGEEWYRLRRVAQQILVRPQKALDYLPLQNEVSDDFIKLLPSIISSNREVTDLNRWLSRWGLESSFNVFLEKRMGFLESSGLATADEIIDKNSDVFTITTKLWFSLPFYKYIPTPSFRRFYESEDFLASFNEKTLRAAVKEYEDQVEGRSQMDKTYLYLSFMLSSKNITWKDVVSISFSVLTDTLSTTVKALLFNLYTLATNPEAQEKAYREALEHLTDSGELTSQGFNACSYIKACMKETFRFFPIGLDVQRLAPCDMVIGGYQVPEGTYICLENYVPLHDPNFIPDPEQFYPERWLRENLTAKDKEHPYILIPFSIGTRMCAGRRFAEQELVMMIAKILTRYRLEWHHKPLDQRYQMLQVPDGEVKVTFVPRNKA